MMNLSDEMFMPIEMTYFSKTKEEILQEAFETIVRAYQDRDADTIITGAASNFSSSGDSIEDRAGSTARSTESFSTFPPSISDTGWNP